MRKLASIQRIASIEFIDNADSIVKASILGWQVVVKRDEFNIGDWCVYCEIDSVMPEKPEFEFLRERKFRNLLGEKTVPVLSRDYYLSNSILELVEMSKGKSTLADTLREGILIRPHTEIIDRDLDCQLVKNRISFKSINPEFLLKHDE